MTCAATIWTMTNFNPTAMQPTRPTEPDYQDDSVAPDSETQSSASSAQGTRNNPELNKAATGTRENEPAEGGRSDE
jgi:hypothetical protein